VLDEIVREAARQMLAVALQAEASARRRDSRRTAAETPKVSVDTSTRPTPSAPAASVSRTTMLAFSA
jgi:hypothetical protein